MMRWLLSLLLLLVAGGAAGQSAFTPGGATVSLAVTGTTARVQIQPSQFNANVRVYNSGTVAVFIQCGSDAVNATTTASMPILAGSIEVLGCASTHVAGITASGTATVYLTPGSGL